MDKDDKTKDLIITEKGKRKWRGDLPALQLFLDEALNIKGIGQRQAERRF
jgi:hypothetical protein